ncbi:MAG: DegT/DnrJ/EryC1/StrS family aminotransferase [Fimbriimonas sp.]
MNKRIYHSTPHMGEMESEFIAEALATNWVAPVGPNLRRFEAELTKLLGVAGCVAVSSGTAALHLTLAALGVGPGDSVFCSDFTYVASVAPIVYLGARPIFIDSSIEDWGMSLSALETALRDADRQGSLPKAIVVVHLYGHCVDIDPLIALCHRYDVTVVEDAAEALGATYKRRPCGTSGNVGFFSFNGNKIITTGGGGAIVSNDEGILAKARYLASHARDPVPHHQHRTIGFNYGLSNVSASIGLGQLKVLDERVARRRSVFELYKERLGDIPGVILQEEQPYEEATFWLTALYLDPKRSAVGSSAIMAALETENIEARPLWMPQHMQPIFKDFPFYSDREDKAVSTHLFENGLCLPSGSNLSDAEVGRVVDCFRRCAGCSA